MSFPTRAIDTVLPSLEAFEQALSKAKAEGRQLRIYFGIDPSSPHMHIGHTIPLRLLGHFQKAGHKAILLIGDFTARLGDPSDKLATRVPLTKEQVEANLATYLEQAGKVIDLDYKDNPVEIRYNSEWSDSMTFQEVVKLAEHFTVQQMLERDMFQRRLQAQKPIALSEFFYPLMQGYDAVALEADAQIGGTDQTFNMLAGRPLNKALRNTEMFVITVPLLADANGVKIGKTAGNAINIDNPPQELYGQIMSLPDEVIVPGFRLLTDVPMEQVEAITQAIEGGSNPMEAKKQLAFTIVEQFNGHEKAEAAQAFFERTVQQGVVEQDAEDRVVEQADWDIVELLVELGLADSKSEARRLFDQGAIEVNNQRLADRTITLSSSILLKVGKRQFLRVHTSQHDT